MNNGSAEQNQAHQPQGTDVPIGTTVKKDVYKLKDVSDHVNCQLLEKPPADQLSDHITEGVSLLTDNRDCDNEVVFEQNRTCECGKLLDENYWQFSEGINKTKYSQLHCSKCITDSPLRTVKGVNLGNSVSDDSVECCHEVNNVSLSSLLENIPLAYNPMTKQLHVLSLENCDNEHSGESGLNNSNASEDSSLSSKQGQNVNVVDKIGKRSCVSESQECIDKPLCNSSLPRTNGSSFSSISSLSTNTDISALSGNDLDSCGTPTEKESQDRQRVDGEHFSFLHENGAKCKKRGISKFLSRFVLAFLIKFNV